MKEKSFSIKTYLLGLLCGLFLAGIAFCIFILVQNNEAKKTDNRVEKIKVPQSLVSVEEGNAVDGKTVQKLQNLEDIIKRQYYLEEVSDEVLRNGLYDGILDSLGDPYSEYYDEEELSAMLESTAGIYYGIGAYVTLDEESHYVKISGTIKNSPAEEAKLRANDLIYQIDETSTYDMSLSDAVALIKGPEFTEVVLHILRDGNPMEVTLKRRQVESPTVEWEMYENNMGYLQITQFDEVTPGQFAEALADLKSKDMKGLILDLRANPGGTLDGVVDIAGQILPKGIVVYTEDKEGNRKDYNSSGKSELDVPMVVLVDMNTASAAEILSGAIQDYGKGTLVGTTTFGKGIVQSVMSLGDGTAIKLTVSAYFTPSGRNIHKTGIKPDVVVEFDSESYYGEEHFDNQLDRAKEILAEKMGIN